MTAGALPVFWYESITVTGPEGEAPLAADSDLVTLITELATVVVSVLVSVVGVVSVTETVMVALLPLTAPAGTVPATTKRNVPPAAIAPDVLIGVALGFHAAKHPLSLNELATAVQANGIDASHKVLHLWLDENKGTLSYKRGGVIVPKRASARLISDTEHFIDAVDFEKTHSGISTSHHRDDR